MLASQIGERYGCKGIYRHRNIHYSNVFRVVGISQEVRYGLIEEQNYCHEEQRSGSYHLQRGGIYLLGTLSFLAHEAEEGSFHAVSKQHYQQCHVGIHVGYDAVLTTGGIELGGLYGHQQVVYKACRNATETVNSRIFCQRF